MPKRKTRKAAAKVKARPRSNNKRSPPSKMIIHNNKKPARRSPTKVTAPAAVEEVTTAERTPLTERIDNMDASHVAVGVGAGFVGTALGVLASGKGWARPKVVSGVLMATGATTTAAGWHWEMDRMMCAGVGLTAAGAFSLSTQLAVDGYKSMEKRAAKRKAEKKAENAEKDRLKKLADARALLAAEEKKRRNAKYIDIVTPDFDDDIDEINDLDDSAETGEADEYPAEAA